MGLVRIEHAVEYDHGAGRSGIYTILPAHIQGCLPYAGKKDIDLMVECIMNSFVQPFIVLVLAWLVARLFF